MSQFTDTEVRDFAECVLDTLEAQRKYFRDGRRPEDLVTSKGKEAKLKRMAVGILEVLGYARDGELLPAQVQLTLWPNEERPRYPD